MKLIGVWAIGATLLTGCAMPRAPAEPYSALGVVQQRIEIRRRGSDIVTDDMRLTQALQYGLYGVVGVLMVDLAFGIPSHFGYEIRLDDGRTVHVRNSTDVPVGSCVALALRPERMLPETEFPYGSNEMELSGACRRGGAAETAQ